ncbi:hypothetical protein [Aquimarina rhabdastrellae]
MKKHSPSSSFSISKIYCSVFGHNYKLSKKVTHHINEYTCCNCKEQITTNSNGRLEVLTPKLKEINQALEFVHAKKQARKQNQAQLQSAS